MKKKIQQEITAIQNKRVPHTVESQVIRTTMAEISVWAAVLQSNINVNIIPGTAEDVETFRALEVMLLEETIEQLRKKLTAIQS